MRNTTGSSGLARWFSKTSTAIITAIAMIVVALIGAYGGRSHERDRGNDRVAHVLRRLQTTEADLRSAQETVLYLERKLKTQVPPASSTTGVVNPVEITTGGFDQPAKREDAEGFTFLLHGCRRSSDTVRCEFTFTNNEKERALGLKAYGSPGASRAFDGSSSEYYADQSGLGSASGTQPGVEIPFGVSLHGWLRFSGVPTRVSSFAVLQLAIEANGSLKIDFHDVRIVGV